ncbi:MAG: macrolide ABC transporter permease, partial [Candidatus Latescibacteria bacterium]|nr:macrolide ABC transporter permease [Candidatus Latescibacterota bacterium]
MADVRAKFPQFVEQHDRLRRYRETYGPAVFDLLPLTRIHHSSTINYPLGTTSNPIYVLSGIAAVVLLIACVNFMTLSLGLASTRFKEVGVRKVMGASRIHLAKRFWGDALLLSMLSL